MYMRLLGDWMMWIGKFLKIFYDATLWFSSANYVTSNSFFLFLEFMSIHDTIDLRSMKKKAIC